MIAAQLILVGALLFSSFAGVSGEAVGWFAGTPQVRSVSTVNSLNRLTKDPCTDMVVSQVVNMGLGKSKVYQENLCMVSTSAGLIDNNGKVIQPNGFTKAYSIKNQTNFIIKPIPNQAGVLAMSSNSLRLHSATVRLYRNFYSHLQFDPFNQYFTLVDNPESVLSFTGGQAMPVNNNTLTYSENGRFIMADIVGHGFVRWDLLTLKVTPFAYTLPVGASDILKSASTAITDSGRFAAIGYNASSHVQAEYYLKVVDLDTCIGQIPNDYYGTTTFNCRTVDVYPAFRSHVPDSLLLLGTRFVNDDTLLIDMRHDNKTEERFALTAAGREEHLVDYLAMGDSYISGEGAFSYRTGTDTNINKCHQSLVSYPYLLAHDFASFASVACSGAVIDNIRDQNDGEKSDQLRNNTPVTEDIKAYAKSGHVPGIILQDDFLEQDNPQVVTLSIGGNDIGFADIGTRCVAPFNFSWDDKDISFSSNCFETYEDRYELVTKINAQFNDLVKTYSQIINSTDRRLYVIGYPQVVSATGMCGPNVPLSKSDREFVVQMAAYLDSVVERAAHKAGAFYVDTQHTFDGHKLCENKPFAMNGLTAGNDKAGILGNESFHPTAYGHQLFADTVAAQTHNLTAPMPEPDPSLTVPAINDDMDILKAPKINRPLYEIINAGKDLTEAVWLPQHVLSISLDGFKGLIKSNILFDVVLHSDPVHLGQVRSDANGVIAADLTLPGNIPAGFHTLHFYGKNIAGDNIDIQKTVYVGASANDYDGDGILNNDETSCMYIPNSGEDYDKDGIDDACDGNITEPPVGETTEPTTNDSNTRTTTFDQSFATAQSLGTGNTVQATATTKYFQSAGTHSTAIDAPAGAEAANRPAVLGASKPEPAKPGRHVWVNWLTAVLLALGLIMLVLRTITVRSRA